MGEGPRCEGVKITEKVHMLLSDIGGNIDTQQQQ